MRRRSCLPSIATCSVSSSTTSKVEFGLLPRIVNGDTSVSAKAQINRQKILKEFQNAPGFGVIILSPLAVGFGVNIQAANHVIHYLRHWNPAKEDQATDRPTVSDRRKTFMSIAL